jgi:hypothetical protein
MPSAYDMSGAPRNAARPRVSEINTIIGTDELYLVQQDGTAQTGFADQSHLSRWVQRVHGVPLTQFVR